MYKDKKKIMFAYYFFNLLVYNSRTSYHILLIFPIKTVLR